MLGIGLMISSLFKPLFFRDDSFFDAIFIVIAVASVVIFEGNLRIDNWLNQKYSWATMPKKRTISQFLTSLIYTVFLLYILMFTIHILKSGKYELFNPKMRQVLIPAIFITIAVIAMDISYQFFKAWKQSLIEVEKYKTESANAQLQNLKNQLNPHFLFNNLSVLTSLVYKDQDKAVDFINQLSKVYRYLLDNKDKELVSLEDELTFIRSYTYLLQIRFDTNIKFDIQVENNVLQKLVPPMAIQILVENAIKHNELSEALPLTVSIKNRGDVLEVTNNLQLRTNTEPSSKTGLKNIKDRYHYFTSEPVEIIERTSAFVVKIPLLKS